MRFERQKLADVLANRPFTLCLSSGFFGFYTHGGMLSALEEAQLVPRRMVGSSAGAIVGGCIASGVPLSEFRSFLFYLKRKDFWDPQWGPGLLRGGRFDELLRKLMPTTERAEFQTPFSCSGWSLEDRCSKELAYEDVVSCIRASAAFPGLFQPVRIQSSSYLDGGIGDRPGFSNLQENEWTLYHHLSTRSPWRTRRGAQAPVTPPNVLTLDLGSFRRLGPFSLDEGPLVWAQARERTLRALEEPIHTPLFDTFV